MRAHCVAMLALAACLSTASFAEPPDIIDLLKKYDDLTRGNSSQARMRMEIKTERWTRGLTMEAQSKGTEKTLIRILVPAKEKGTATLKVENNIWNYLPKVDRTIKVPGSMMSAGWMGSHVTNDDLVQESRYSEDYDCRYVQLPSADSEHYVADCIPKPDAPIVWGKVTIQVRAQDELVDEVRYYDEDGTLIRSLFQDEIKEMDGRLMPTRMRVQPADKPDEFTEIVYENIEFDIDISDRTFSLQALRR